MDKYITKYLREVNKAKTNEEKRTILDQIYQDGFEDGTNEAPKILPVKSNRKYT